MVALSEAPSTPSPTVPMSGGAGGPGGARGRGGAADPSAMPLERVEAEICTLAGQIAAATSRFLHLLADFDSREGWAGWGVHSCAHWLSWRCGLDLRTAHEHVRVARALRELPKVSGAFAQGRVSYSKVRAVCRVATAENESDLLDAALDSPAAHVERLVRGLRKAQRNLDDERRRRAGGEGCGSARARERRVQWRWDDDGCLVIWGRLSAEDGARLLAGLSRMDHERRRTEAGRDTTGPGCGQLRSAEHSDGAPPADLGPALVAGAELMCTAVDIPVHAPAADVLVHVEAERLVEAALRGEVTQDDQTGTGDARLDDGPAVEANVLQMLACDGRIQLSVRAADGRTLNLGRRRRRPNRAQLDTLWRRDRGCAHPGCGRTRFLHAHHVVPWAGGGRTDVDNLVLLCGEHHRSLHDGGFSIVALGKQRFRFHGPGGAVRPPAPRMSGEATALVAAHAGIGPTTIEPDWDGSPLDLVHAVDVYLTAWANRRSRN
jgi:Domain of unknown function (DUF222)/HNH endonuclease